MYIPKDEYNPFCSNHMDPPGTSDLFGKRINMAWAKRRTSLKKNQTRIGPINWIRPKSNFDKFSPERGLTYIIVHIFNLLV